MRENETLLLFSLYTQFLHFHFLLNDYRRGKTWVGQREKMNTVIYRPSNEQVLHNMHKDFTHKQRI